MSTKYRIIKRPDCIPMSEDPDCCVYHDGWYIEGLTDCNKPFETMEDCERFLDKLVQSPAPPPAKACGAFEPHEAENTVCENCGELERDHKPISQSPLTSTEQMLPVASNNYGKLSGVMTWAMGKLNEEVRLLKKIDSNISHGSTASLQSCITEIEYVVSRLQDSQAEADKEWTSILKKINS